MCANICTLEAMLKGLGDGSVDEVLAMEACRLEFGSPVFVGDGNVSVIPEPGRWAHQELHGTHCPAA